MDFPISVNRKTPFMFKMLILDNRTKIQAGPQRQAEAPNTGRYQNTLVRATSVMISCTWRDGGKLSNRPIGITKSWASSAVLACISENNTAGKLIRLKGEELLLEDVLLLFCCRFVVCRRTAEVFMWTAVVLVVIRWQRVRNSHSGRHTQRRTTEISCSRLHE